MALPFKSSLRSRITSHRHRRPVIFYSAIGLVVFLVALRLALPSIGKYYINKALATQLEHYTGHIEDFDLSLYRGAYQLQGLEILKKKSPLPPILKIAEIDLSLAWRALLRREISADISVRELDAFLADDEKKGDRQLGTEEGAKPWQDVFETLIPISIESLVVKNSTISFTNQSLKQPLPVQLSQIELTAKNLRTRPSRRTSPLSLSALLQNHARLNVNGQIDALASPPRADLDIKLLGFRMNTVNQILRLYVPLDITEGTFDLYVEAASAKGEALGKAKIFFKEGDIVAPKQKFVSFRHVIFEILGALGNWILKNNETRKVAAEIPFEYNDGKFNWDASDAFWSAVENRVDQMKPGFDNDIDLGKLRAGKATEASIR